MKTVEVEAVSAGLPTPAHTAEEGEIAGTPASTTATVGSPTAPVGAVAVGPPGPTARTAERIDGSGSNAVGWPALCATPEADDPAQATMAATRARGSEVDAGGRQGSIRRDPPSTIPMMIPEGPC